MYKKLQLMDLPYNYDDLEPHIDQKTIMIHHDRHHQKYLDNFNKAVEKNPKYQEYSLEELLKNVNNLPNNLKESVKKHGGGVYNHNLYFSTMKKNIKMSPEFKKVLESNFGTVEKFKDNFKKNALSVFGSGWTYLVKDQNSKLKIVNTQNQETPLKDNLFPILNIDLWEHSYYLNYQNKRAAYIDEWFQIINWEQVYKNYLKD